MPQYLANIVYLLPFHQVSTSTSSSLTTACMTPITNPDKMWQVDLVWWHFCHEAPFCILTRQLALVVVGGVTAVGRQQPLGVSFSAVIELEWRTCGSCCGLRCASQRYVPSYVFGVVVFFSVNWEKPLTLVFSCRKLFMYLNNTCSSYIQLVW